MTQEVENNLYAIIQTGSKQYRVKPGDLIDVEYLQEDLDEEVTFSDVLFYNDGTEHHIGTPALTNVQVKGMVVDYVQGPKVVAFKYRRRKKSKKKIGHRQGYSRVQILSIVK
jgi:large subunit ribosomal protein L21